jgi:TolB-like protein
VLAWYHGDRGHQKVSGREFAILTVLLLLGGGMFWWVARMPAAPVAITAQPGGSQEQAPAATGPSIAVLPFVNMSTDVENGFFADGISEELLNVLASVDGLKVASRTSAFSFKGKDIPIPEIARQLGVEHVLEGSVRKQGQRVRITAQLIHAGSDGHLWSETYDRDLTDIFKVQEEIAQAITRELEGIIGKRQVAVVASTDNLEAYQSFLQGRARFHRRDELLAAIDDLSSAVKLDPNFAEAWIYLAATWAVLPGYVRDEARVARSETETAAALKHAEALAPKHPMALALRSRLLENSGELAGALALLEESARLSVQDSTPTLWRGTLLLRSGYIEEAIAVLENAQRMDPLSGVITGYLALAYLSSGQYDKAEANARKAMSQGWEPALTVAMSDAAARGEHAKALSLFDELVRRYPTLTEKDRRFATNYRELLRNPENAAALKALREEDEAIDLESSIAINRFDIPLGVVERDIEGDPDAGRRQWWLRSAWLPSTVGLRTNPRFFAIAEKLGFVRFWEARGYPSGCKRVSAPGGDHLDCKVTSLQ